MKPCPKCGEQIKETLKFCVYCGCNIAQEEAKAKAKFCGECGAQIEDGMKFCGECGAKVESASSKQNDDPWFDVDEAGLWPVEEGDETYDAWGDLMNELKQQKQTKTTPKTTVKKTSAKKATTKQATSTTVGESYDLDDTGLNEFLGQMQKDGIDMKGLFSDTSFLDDPTFWQEYEYNVNKKENWQQECFDAGQQAEQKGDFAKALVWYKKAADEEDGRAMGMIGKIFQFGMGVAVDLEKAFKWYERGTLYDDAFSCNALGAMYFNGAGVKRDYNEAKRYFEKAAYYDFADAYVNLGFMYEQGIGVIKSEFNAGENYERAAELGNVWAQNQTGLMYLYTDYGFVMDDDNCDENAEVERDFASAKKWFEKAMKNGNTNAMTNLCVIYANGYGVAKDDKKAFSLAKKAVENGGDANAKQWLAWFYQNGVATAKDIAKAKILLQQAANEGSQYAKQELAKLD